MYEFDRIKKSNEDLLEDMIRDTFEHKLHWYSDDDIDYLYCRKIIPKNDFSNIKNDNDKIFIIFKISDQETEEEYDDIPYQFQAYFEPPSIISLEIYISKNNKKEIFCKRITDHQLKLAELLSAVIHNYKKRPKKNA